MTIGAVSVGVSVTGRLFESCAKKPPAAPRFPSRLELGFRASLLLVSLAVALVGGLYLVLLLISLNRRRPGIPGRAVVVGVRLRRDQAGRERSQVRRGVALGLLLLAGAGCQESMTEKITRECDEAALVYFAARAYAPTYWADLAAGAAWEREKPEFQRKHREAEEKERYVSDPDGKLRDALLVAWLHQSVAIDKRRPAKREPTAAEREERQAAHEQWAIEEWGRDCRQSRAARVKG